MRYNVKPIQNDKTMKTIIIILVVATLVGLFLASVIAKDDDTIYEIGEQDEEARKKLLEQQDKDIDLD
jgi:Na+-translocating ferredoxin:NAD+ oxidoreductase RnfG subunit